MNNLEQQKTDEMYMRRCIQLARNGEVGAPPNPMVGAVVVCDGRIIGEGYHRRCGGPHAEVNAIASVKEPSLLQRSTIYVSLEPCAHYGKTPPCADLIVEKRIPRVVIGCQDPFAKVDGLGIKKLRDAGCEVVVGVLQEECLRLNKRFMTYHTLKRPYVTLKWAQSCDGFVDFFRSSPLQSPAHISTPTTQTLVHRLRATHQAILVGGRTALLDNPTLTTRVWPGPSPLRVVIDTHGDLPADLRLLTDGGDTLLYHRESLQDILSDLHAQGVQSLLVEGGPATLQRFIDEMLWDEARVEVSPEHIVEGVAVPQLGQCQLLSRTMVDGHELLHYAP